MPVHDALHGRKPDPGPLELVRRMKALKNTEQLGLIGRIETGAVITDEVRRLPFDRHHTDLDPRAGALAGELPCVAKQVFQRYPQQRRVPLRTDAIADDDLDL